MDPFSAFSLAASVAQLVDFGSKLISEGQEIYHSATGSSQKNVDLETICLELSRLGDKLKASAQSTSVSSTTMRSREEKALGSLAGVCKDVADELLSVVQKLKVTEGPHRRMRSFHQALKSVWKKDRIDAFQKRLDGFRKQLSIQLIALLRYIIFIL